MMSFVARRPRLLFLSRARPTLYSEYLHHGHSKRPLTTQFTRPSPPLLPSEDQREFEELQRTSQIRASSSAEADLTMHPDARRPIKPEFDGETNPLTGEMGGPKNEPVKKWGEAEDSGDWSFKGRVSDF